MKPHFLPLVCVFAIAAALVAGGQSESHWEDYKPRTLQSIMEMHGDPPAESLDSSKSVVFVSSDSFPSKVKLVYLAKSRPLPADKSELLTYWTKSVNRQATTPEMFQTEVLFREGADEHWIAVQKPLLAALPKEVKSGQSLEGYIIFMGFIKKAGEQREWLFAMNEFDRP